MRCRQCGRPITPKEDRYILSILDDPVLCSRTCVTRYISDHQPEVDRYVEEFLVCKEVPRCGG